MKKLYIDKQNNSSRVAMTEDGALVEFQVERPTSKKMVGNIYRGKVVKIHPAMEVAFVRIMEDKNAFLYIGENIDETSPLDGMNADYKRGRIALKEGDSILCQVIKDEFGNKNARITMDVTLPGKLLVMMPKTGYIGVSAKITAEAERSRLMGIMEELKGACGYIIRTAASGASRSDLIEEAEDLREKWKVIAAAYEKSQDGSLVYQEEDLVCRSVRDMLTADVDSLILNDEELYKEISAGRMSYCPKEKAELYTGALDMMSYYGLTPEIEALTKKVVVMKNGSTIVIDKAEALTVIDVNTGKYVGDKNDNLEGTVFNTNMLAAAEIARQLRLRNIGGIIIVDFIDMEIPEHRAAVLAHFSEELKKDRIKTTLVGMTSLGLVELTRKKMRASISSHMLQHCPYCKGDGYVLSDEYMISRIRESLLKLFSDTGAEAVSVAVNPSIAGKITELKYFKVECETVWRGKRIYILSDPAMHMEKYCIAADKGVETSLPAGALPLYGRRA